MGRLPLLGGCSAAFLISCLFMRNTIMTEKIARRGVRVPGEYAADFLDQIQAGAASAKPVVSLREDQTLDEVRAFVQSREQGSSHQGFPVVDARGLLVGVVTRRDILDPATPGTRRGGGPLPPTPRGGLRGSPPPAGGRPQGRGRGGRGPGGCSGRARH